MWTAAGDETRDTSRESAKSVACARVNAPGYWHALPENWHLLPYDEFLAQRRKLIAQVTRDAFDQLSRSTEAPIPLTADIHAAVDVVPDEPSLAVLLHEGYLLPGDQLDPLDPDWVVDAVVTDDGTVQIDGVHEFDTLDDAAHFLDVTNVSGFEFWALEHDGGLASLAEIVAAGSRSR